METGKPGLASASVHSSITAQTEKRMDNQAPLTAVYIHTVPALPAQPYPQPPADAWGPATLHLAMPPLYSKEMLPFLTLHIAGGLQSQPGLSLAAAAPAARSKSAGKHVCSHCGRDCMKPSVLEKHLRCHTGERPYPCTTCGVSFKTQSNLYKHKRTQAHARLSSESEQSSLGSLDSMSSPRDIHASSLSVDESTEELGSVEKNPTLPAMTCPAQTTKVYSVNTQGSGGEKTESTPVGHRTEPNESAKVTKEEEKQKVENEKPLLTVSRHIPLQRQEATLFSKQWESSVSSGKSQSHESTDSGFSESSDHYSSPASVLPDHSMDSLTESTREHLKEITSTQRPSEPSQGEQEPKDNAKQQGQKTLEERISKLISENTAVVEDKQLENVRPRKTVLSKQGSIDLPMPYTYKDSFHFDMRINKTINGGLQRNRKPGLYSSVPTQHSTTIEHAPLTRSNSLPFSVTLLQPERSSPKSCYQSDYVTLFRRGSSGQINPTGFAIKPVNQQSSTHRPLVRQAAVDCNHTTDGLFVNSSVEEVCAGSLSCDGDGGDICGEPSNRKFRRKKAQKFAYHKWYMYGGGTFKKLYNVEKGGDSGVIKGRKSINPEHEVVPGPKKKLSTVHKETVATTGSAINITSSNETVCHQGCPPAKPSLISAADYDLKTSHLHASNSFLKTPLRRNLSLSILPLPSVASLGGHKTSSLSSVETGGLTNEEKHTDPTPQLCGAHVPSDRKKQRTDDKITSPLKMEVNPSTMSHPPPSIVGSRPQHDTHLSYINLQTNQKHMQLKGVLFPPCIINANALSVNTSPATSISSAAKTSFLPKYQLKLPNADSNTSLHVGDKPTGIEDHTFTSALSSSHNDQTSALVTTSEKKDSDPVTSPLMQTCEMKKTFSTTQAHLLSPCMATTLCQVKTSRFNENAAPSLSVVQRPFAATTITTTCLKDYQSGLCSTSIQPSRSDTASVPLQLHRPVEPTVAHIPAMPLITTASNQTSTAAVTAFSQSQSNSNPPLSHSQLSTASDPVNRAYASPNTASVPCHIVPCDMVQPAAQNVFHVHTADLQICLQLISDEQLALIEPQIENQADSSLSQRSMEALGPEVTQSKVQSSVTMEISSEGRGHQHLGHQKEMDQSGSLATLHKESKKPPLSVHFGKVQPNIHMIEHSNSSQAAVSAESKPPETLGLTLHPHKYSHVNTATETLNSSSSAMSAAASHKGVKSGRRQTSQEERTPSLNHCAEEQLLLDRRVSQGQLVSQTLSGQHSLSVTCLSPSTVNQNSTRSDLLEKESQQKLSSRLESGEPHPSLQVKSSQASSVAGADELSGLVSTFSFNKCKTPRQLKPQASIYSGNPAEPTLSETLNPSQHASRGCDRVGPLDNSSPLQEMTFNESQDVICSAHSEQQLGLFTSVTSNIQVERPRNTPAVLTHIQSPSTGLTEGASQMGCAAQKESQTWAHGGLSLGQPDSTDWRPKQSREAGETNHHSVEGQGGGAVMGEDNNRGIKSDQVPDQWGNTKTKCRYMGSSDMLKPVGEDKQVKADSCKNSWLSEQDLQHHSQTHSGMFECPPQSPLQAPSSSGNLNMPVSSGTTGLFNSAQPLLEMSNFYFSQQHWESSIIHNHQAQRILSEFSSSEHIKEQDKSQNAFSQIECSPQQRFPLQDEKQDQKQKSPRLSPDVKTSSIRHYCQVSHSVQGSRATAGYKGDNNMLDNRLPSKTFNYAEPEQNTKDWASNDYTVQSSNSGRPDTTNKYQSLLLAGQLQGYQSAECLTSGVRPVQSCQDYAGDTSSSDDEGKLIIALGEK